MVRSEGATLEEWRWMLSLYSPSCRCEGVTALLPMPVGLIEDAARGLQAEETTAHTSALRAYHTLNSMVLNNYGRPALDCASRAGVRGAFSGRQPCHADMGWRLRFHRKQ